MTLRKRREGKIREKSLYPQESFISIKKAMEQSAPGMVDTAVLHSIGDFTISFDASSYNKGLDKKLRELNKTGIDFDYRIDKVPDFVRPAKLGIVKSDKRLVIMFSPKSDLEWAHIRTIFGLNDKLTDEVSSEETINLIGED